SSNAVAVGRGTPRTPTSSRHRPRSSGPSENRPRATLKPSRNVERGVSHVPLHPVRGSPSLGREPLRGPLRQLWWEDLHEGAPEREEGPQGALAPRRPNATRPDSRLVDRSPARSGASRLGASPGSSAR